MSNTLRWACVCAVVVGVLGSSGPLFGQEFELWDAWHYSYDDTDSDAQLGRTARPLYVLSR